MTRSLFQTGYSESFAQLGDAVKSQLSHRAKAVELMYSILEK